MSKLCKDNKLSSIFTFVKYCKIEKYTRLSNNGVNTPKIMYIIKPNHNFFDKKTSQNLNTFTIVNFSILIFLKI